DTVKNDWTQDPRCTWRAPGFAQADDEPVVCVSWNDAVAFVEWLARKDGKPYRLPTEAEWEHACRAGTSTPVWVGSSASSHQANFNGNFPYGGAKKGPYLAKTSKVGSYPPNAWGLYDTHGNVWEWCADWYDEHYYAKSPAVDPPGPATGTERILRGSSWLNWGKGVCRAAVRGGYAPASRYNYRGLR